MTLIRFQIAGFYPLTIIDTLFAIRELVGKPRYTRLLMSTQAIRASLLTSPTVAIAPCLLWLSCVTRLLHLSLSFFRQERTARTP